METRDHVQPEPDDRDDEAAVDDTAIFTLGDGTARIEQPELHRLLRGIADGVASAPRGDFYPQVIRRAESIRRRRRAVRASSATAVLAAAVVFGPTVAHELGAREGVAVAAPPSAVVDMASAYPEADATEGASADFVPMAAARPANALSWPARGDALPAEASSLATSYLVDRGIPGMSEPSRTSDGSGAAGASVTTLWAGVEDDTTGIVTSRPAGDAGINVNGSPERLVVQDAHKTWLFVLQGWQVGPDGAPASQAVLLVGTYTQSTAGSSMTVYSTPVAFAHARPGSGDDKNDTDQIAELSIWLPDSGRLLVLGAPQTKTVLYAKTGGDLIPQKTVDGVAVFPRTRSLVKGHFADTVQVRDAKNVALTPPKAWSAGDFALSGVQWRWSSERPAWVSVTASPVPEPTASMTSPAQAPGGRGKTSPPSPGSSGKVTAPSSSAPATAPAKSTRALGPIGPVISTTVGFVDAF